MFLTGSAPDARKDKALSSDVEGKGATRKTKGLLVWERLLSTILRHPSEVAECYLNFQVETNDGSVVCDPIAI